MSSIEPVRYEDLPGMLFAGVRRQYSGETNHLIPEQWATFMPMIPQVPGRADGFMYGLIAGGDETGNLDYMVGLRVTNLDTVPCTFDRMILKPQHYAVFEVPEEPHALPKTWMAVFQDWLPNSGRENAGTAEFERYSEDFDPTQGKGAIEIWMAINKVGL